jgi:hypothetical protein
VPDAAAPKSNESRQRITSIADMLTGCLASEEKKKLSKGVRMSAAIQMSYRIQDESARMVGVVSTCDSSSIWFLLSSVPIFWLPALLIMRLLSL